MNWAYFAFVMYVQSTLVDNQKAISPSAWDLIAEHAFFGLAKYKYPDNVSPYGIFPKLFRAYEIVLAAGNSLIKVWGLFMVKVVKIYSRNKQRKDQRKKQNHKEFFVFIKYFLSSEKSAYFLRRASFVFIFF